MKLKRILEARLASGQQNDVIAKWLLNGLETTYDRGTSAAHRLFIGTVMRTDPEGGLENAVKVIQEWNTVVKFIRKHVDYPISYDEVRPQELEKWIQHWKAT